MTGMTQERTREQILDDMLQNDDEREDWNQLPPSEQERALNLADWALETYGARRYAEVLTCMYFG